jgi:hypothetical protein
MLNADDFVVGKDEIGRSTVGLNKDGLGKETVFLFWGTGNYKPYGWASISSTAETPSGTLYFATDDRGKGAALTSAQAKQIYLDFSNNLIDVVVTSYFYLQEGSGAGDRPCTEKITYMEMYGNTTSASVNNDYTVVFKTPTHVGCVNWDGGNQSS